MFRKDIKSVARLLTTAFLIVALTSGFFSVSAQADEAITFTLYGIEYTVEEQVINLAPSEVEKILSDTPEWDPEVVKGIQRALKANGHTIPVDGIFGPKTGMAVKRFQQKKHITIDGVPGPVTLGKLNEPDRGIYPYYAPDLLKAIKESPVGKLVHLNVRSHLVEAFFLQEDGIHLLRVMLAATGDQTGDNFTNLCNRRLSSTPHLGGRIGKNGWRGEYAVPITAGDYFHSVLAHYLKVKVNHKTVRKWVLDDNSVLGTNASHGCVRLAVEDAYWLQRFCEKGTAIVVDDRNWDLSVYVENFGSYY